METNIISTPAGSPKCSCNNPDTCIHSVTITTKDNTYSYIQGKQIPDIYLHDKDGKGAEINIQVVDKSCISNNPNCPAGVLYGHDNFLQLGSGAYSDTLRYIDDNASEYVHNMDIITLLSDVIWYKIDHINPTEYNINIGECAGYPLINQTIHTDSETVYTANIGCKSVVNNTIYVYPRFGWTIDVKIGRTLSSGTKPASDKERKEEKERQSESAGYNPSKTGWTRVGKNMITSGLEAKGSATFYYGDAKPKNFDELVISTEFKKFCNKLKILNKAEKMLNVVGSMFSDTKSGSIKRISTEFLYPGIAIKGKGELSSAKECPPYFKRSIIASLSPLIGVRVKFDLLQIFLLQYGKLFATAREKMQDQKNRLDKGKENVGGYIIPKLDFIVEGKIIVGFSLESDEKNNYHYQLGNPFEGRLTLTLDAVLQIGVKVFFIEGVFTFEGKAIAEGCFSLDNKVKDKLEIVLYHSDVTAEVSYQVTFGVGSTKRTELKKDSGKVNDKDTLEKWVIFKKLEKKDSTWRFYVSE
ncbi:hypothetical protein [Escherichia coli]|uniref:hypothetical protein n=1 Tax=Escherichia coli TaxID=562 RepID=UPI0013DE513E|nr:hypothetical protein [Escherichia coli]QIF19910.1 hypothetical protein G6Z93_18150 [Escherichia coli]